MRRKAGLVAVLLMAASFARADGDAGGGWNPNKDIVQQFFQKFNAGDIDGVRATFTPDADIRGAVGWGKVDTVLPLWKEGMNSLHVHLTVDDIITEGDLVAVRLTEKGTSSAPFFNFPATGKSYQVVAMEWFQIRDGKIARRWGTRDAAAIARQLGWKEPVTSTSLKTSEPDQCEVHQQKLRDARASISYGRPKIDADYQSARDRNFPHCSGRVLGGCEVQEAKSRMIRVCPKCDAAKADWLKAHPGTSDATL